MTQLPDAERVPGSSPGRSRAIALGALAFFAASSKRKDAGVEEQAADCFAQIDAQFGELGVDKRHYLMVQVYLADLGEKAALDRAWAAWVGQDPHHWPVRTCMGLTLPAGERVEVTAIGARELPVTA